MSRTYNIKNKGSVNDIYHSKSKNSKRIISEKDFTYKEKLSIINSVLVNNRVISILDIGCGVGTVDFYIAKKYKKSTILGIDIAKNAIKIANNTKIYLNLTNLNFKKEDFLKNKIKNKFDLIICNEVLEHLENDSKAVSIIYKLLNKNGIVIFSVPSINAPIYKLGLAQEFDKRVGHLRRYSVTNIQTLLIKNKFEILRTIQTEGIIRNSLFTINLLGKLIRFIKFFLINLVYFIDGITIKLFGSSDITVIAQKK